MIITWQKTWTATGSLWRRTHHSRHGLEDCSSFEPLGHAAARHMGTDSKSQVFYHFLMSRPARFLATSQKIDQHQGLQCKFKRTWYVLWWTNLRYHEIQLRTLCRAHWQVLSKRNGPTKQLGCSVGVLVASLDPWEPQMDQWLLTEGSLISSKTSEFRMNVQGQSCHCVNNKQEQFVSGSSRGEQQLGNAWIEQLREEKNWVAEAAKS